MANRIPDAGPCKCGGTTGNHDPSCGWYVPPRHGTRDKIERLRARLNGPRADLRAVMLGILDLLGDEL